MKEYDRAKEPYPLADFVLRPIEQLTEAAKRADREIEKCWWFRRGVQVDIDQATLGNLQNPELKQFLAKLQDALIHQGHPQPGTPNDSSEAIIGALEIPDGPGTLFDRVKEIDPPMAKQARERYNLRRLPRNYTLAVSLSNDLAALPKRKMEETIRMLMTRLGAFKIALIHPEYYALATMEGGLGRETGSNPQAINNMRDRVVTHTIAKDSGSFQEIQDIIPEQLWSTSEIPGFITNFFRKLGNWNYIDPPFDIGTVASKKITRLVKAELGWSRQSESAGAVAEPIALEDYPQLKRYLMGQTSTIVLATASGRFNIDKTDMNPETDVTPVTIIPKGRSNPPARPMRERPDKSAGLPPADLYSFQRLALGIIGREIKGPSIEFDEMAVAFFTSPTIRVSPHPLGRGWKLNPRGTILMPRVRAFVHIHQGVELILPSPHWGKNALDLVEYISYNFEEYPYPVGCGKDIVFACTADAVQRSLACRDINSDYLVAAADALDHGINFYLITAPIPGTDWIPDDPFFPLETLIHPETGLIKLTSEVPNV